MTTPEQLESPTRDRLEVDGRILAVRPDHGQSDVESVPAAGWS